MCSGHGKRILSVEFFWVGVMRSGEVANPQASQNRHLLLGTVSFTVCFAAWGLVSAFAPHFRQLLHLSATQTAFLVAVPVLLGSLARIPMGMLTDRFGGRIVFSALMFLVAVPVALVPIASGHRDLLIVAFLLGMAGSSFAVGVGYVSRWFSMERQGSALGVYGLGNIGQSAAVFLGPVVAAAYGFRTVYWGMSVILLVWAVVFVVFARNAAETVRPKSLSEMFGVLAHEPLAWALSAFYFLTFGGFVAFSIYLPTLLRDQFGLRPADAGFRTAGFVVLATLCRPLGGWLSDRIGGSRVLSWVLPAVAAFGLLLGIPRCCRSPSARWDARPCSASAMARCFKLVPRYFPDPDGHRHRTGRRDGRHGRILSSSAPRRCFATDWGVVWPGFLLLSAVACCSGG